jgi:hypothetical protein
VPKRPGLNFSAFMPVHTVRRARFAPSPALRYPRRCRVTLGANLCQSGKLRRSKG